MKCTHTFSVCKQQALTGPAKNLDSGHVTQIYEMAPQAQVPATNLKCAKISLDEMTLFDFRIYFCTSGNQQN